MRFLALNGDFFVFSDRILFLHHMPPALSLHPELAPAFNAWTIYGLGSENENLPRIIVLKSIGEDPEASKSVWGVGYLPSEFQGVQCRTRGEPVLFLSHPQGISSGLRRKTLHALADINQQTASQIGGPETLLRTTQYELAFLMQTSASEAFGS